jgi:hypothetical protein
MAHRTLAPVKGLTKALIPLPGSFTLTSVKASLALATLGDAALNTVIEATFAGDQGNRFTFAAVGDKVSAAATLLRSGNAFTLHFEPGVTDVTAVEALITGLAGVDDLIAVKTGGTGATKLAAGTAFAATALAGGVATTKKGMGFTVTHASDAAGVYDILFTNKYSDLVTVSANLQLATADDKAVEVQTWTDSTKVLRIAIYDISGTAYTDVAANADNRINFTAWFTDINAVHSRG